MGIRGILTVLFVSLGLFFLATEYTAICALRRCCSGSFFANRMRISEESHDARRISAGND